MDIKNSIRTLRIFALLLFITPSIGLLGSLVLHNYLVNFKYTHEFNYNFEEYKPGNSLKKLCNEENNYCNEDKFKRFTSLGQCYNHIIHKNYVDQNDKKIKIDVEDIKNYEGTIFLKIDITNIINENCIRNKISNNFYNIFPLFYESIYKLKSNEKTTLGTSEAVNPLIYGETSISNIVKRFPVKYFFKPILYLSVIFMIFYWLYYNRILKEFNQAKNNYYFFTFGILSALFLLLHVFFLGWTFESEILTKIRRVLVVFFILFEVLAQTFLLRKIFAIKNKINSYVNLIIVYLKLIFVLVVCFSTMIILTILIFYNLDAKFDYVLEWNYFLLLLLFYFLSFLMWKRKN
tara:strand:- start:80 stop:1123 length:1044 start_codon:yes stop_codon:yes gene_type:complete